MSTDETPTRDAPAFAIMQKHARERILTGKAWVVDLGNGLRAVGERTAPHVIDAADIYEYPQSPRP